MNDTETKNRNPVKDALEILPENIRDSIARRINDVISYEPVIGIMGKTGAGKSSLCNAIFKGDICAVSDVAACTRETQEMRIQFGKRSVLMNPLMILVKIIKLRWIHILSYDQMVSRKIN
ncbi:50S ribosome-binding GTPase, partial [Enterobacter hormaechei subsp. xiangfangensis]|nr:50S ribosome-binding GTPase [Enterobacter hormaechei subsp. xiangfangensis]